jgi:hypothetical protein
MTAITTPGRSAWEEPVFLPPLGLRDSERRDCCAPAWFDQIAAVLELQEAIRAVGGSEDGLAA